MICPNCGTENPEGNRFCGNCASALELVCTNCGAANPPNMKFCGQCATPFEAAPDETPSERTERRLVTVLFADLTGYTSFSEGRDSEEVRGFLTTYFDKSRAVIERFGGLVEKFIGDAVMAVWGADVAHEDDAERAVRAGLELAELVEKLAADIGVNELRLRVGVHTGEAAVGSGNDHMGFVTGDLVNTASRLESAAEPGTVLVGKATKESASRAIGFDSAGEQTLKGKTSPVATWRATHILSEVGGHGRSDVIEPPFIGRTNELRLLKDVLESVKSDSQARLVSLVGEAGIGKTRLVWELKKYADGMIEDLYWHDGRSLAYGDGVAFWAVAEMIRARAGVKASAPDEEVYQRLSEVLGLCISAEEDREWLLPRLAAILGTGQAPAGGRSELDAAARAFFEGISNDGPVMLVFEDVHWADNALLDFIEELTEWWRDHPIMIVTVGRTDLLDRRPGWGTTGTNTIALSLGPLADSQISALVRGTIPDLPRHAAESIVDKAAGIPLYAVEMIRGLVADGSVELHGDELRPVGTLEEISVPESLQSVIGARLDRLEESDRDLIQEAAVLGMSFSATALAQLTEIPEQDIRERLNHLVERDVLVIIKDPRSSERGNYQFVQGLIREVALGRMSRDVRRERHLRVAEFFEARDEPELAEITASHYLSALEVSPDGPEREELKRQAIASMKLAVDRALNVRSQEQVVSISAKAIEMADSAEEKEPFWEASIIASTHLGRHSDVERFGKTALDHYRAAGDQQSEWRIQRHLGFALAQAGYWQRVVDLLQPVIDSNESWEDEIELVEIAAVLGRALSILFLEGTRTDAPQTLGFIDATSAAAERFDLTREIVDLMVSRASLLGSQERLVEAGVLFDGAIKLAAEHDLLHTEVRARNNFVYLTWPLNPSKAIPAEKRGRDIAVRAGDRNMALVGSFVLSAFRTIAGDFQGARDEIEPYADVIEETNAFWSGLLLLGFEGDRVAAQAEVDRWNQLPESQRQEAGAWVVAMEAAYEVFFGDIERGFEETMEAMGTNFNLAYVNLPGLLIAGLHSGRAGYFSRMNETLSNIGPMAPITEYLNDLNAVSEGRQPDRPLQQHISDMLDNEAVLIAACFLFGAVRHLDRSSSEWQEFHAQATSIATERGWNGFLRLLNSGAVNTD